MIQDYCQRVGEWTVYRDLDIRADANLGNNWHTYPATPGILKNCIPSRNPLYQNGTVECFWAGSQYAFFAGWHPDVGQAKASPYGNALYFYGF